MDATQKFSDTEVQISVSPYSGGSRIVLRVEGVVFLPKNLMTFFFSHHTLDTHVRFKLNSSKPVSTTPTSLFISP